MVQPDLIVGFTKDQLDALNVLGTWVSAFGSIAAAVVALYLANRAGAQKVRINVATVITFTAGHPLFQPEDETKRFLRFEVVNTGDRPVRITNLGWRTGFFRKFHCVQMIPAVVGNSAMPVSLDHGELASWLIPLDNSSNSWERHFADTFLRDAGISKFLSLRGTCQTSLGNVFVTRPGAELIKRLKSAYLTLE